ncbi:polymorphic toxin-type HINT domain-containing protein [Streptomyces sp. Edi4]|uniref:polymorphic toxin-type HINT domain-containing protein n=1 Tax=Streptomyces sp. Edi4 TaxID=3162527 RepID=UPI00330620D7
MSMAVAAVADTGGSQGDYTATSLSASGSWTQTASGAFTYSYPIALPPALGGGSPAVSLSYDSQAIDGKTSARNSQSSWLGDGWSYAPGSIERTYKGCKYDGIKDSGDLCWSDFNATLSLGSRTGQLVRASDGTYRLQSDDGTKIERLTGAANGLWGGEYFKVTTPDGTAYYLGANHAPGTTADGATNSAWGAPIYHPKSGDPCYDAAKGNKSQCDKPVGYRFNLDFVVDPHGNVQRFDYATESNYYNMGHGQVAATGGGGTLTQYVRGGYPTRISYGFTLSDAVAGKDPAARVIFNTAQRCVTSDSVCTYGNLSKSTATNWPDVPYDTNCPSTYKTSGEGDDVCLVGSPTFWSTYRLKNITTQIKTDDGFHDVDSYTLTHLFSDAGGVIDPVTGKTGDKGNAGQLQSIMWLSSIQHTGLDTSAGSSDPVALDPVTFTGVEMDNRVDGLEPGAPPLYHPRISSIRTEAGSSIAVTYRDPECSRVNHTMPSSPDNNTMACYGVHWTPAGAATPIADWFHKTLVAQVVTSDLTKAGSPAQVSSYTYSDGAAWHRDDSDSTDDQYRDWREFRGYRTVTTTTGAAPDPITKTVSTYLQGMDGDYKADGTQRTVTVTNALNEHITDSNWLAGTALQTETYANANGIVTSRVINGPFDASTTLNQPRTAWTSKDPAPAKLSTLPDLTARRTISDTQRGLGRLADGTWRTGKKVTGYDSLGRVHQVDSQGDVADPKQQTCTTTNYADAPPSNPMMLTYPSETIAVAGPCDTVPDSRTTLNYKRLFYDGDGSITTLGTTGKLGQTWSSDGKTHSLGYITGTQTLKSYDDSGAPVFQTAGAISYDGYGRVTKAVDAAGQVTSTTYTPATATLPTQVTTVSPQPFNWTSTATMAPARGLTTHTVDVNGRITDTTYDSLGRRTQVWKPGRNKATQTPDYKFTYTVRSAGDSPSPSTITTQSLREDGTYSTAVAFYDGMLHERQVQKTTADDSSGRLISSTRYDSHGWAVSTIAPYSEPTTAPSTTMWVEYENTVPNQTLTGYDGQGRPAVTELWSRAVKLWKSTVAHPGFDRTETTPPDGGQSTVTLTNGLGQQTATQSKDTTPDRRLPPGTTIASGSTIASNSVRLAMQADGNLVLTGIANSKTLWASNTAGNPGANATVRPDGNLVVTSVAGTVLWSSGTGAGGATGAYALVRDDASVQIYNSSNTSIWSTGTTGQATAADVTTSYTYTPAGQVASISDTVGNTWTYGYNLLGQKTSQSDPDAGTSTYAYDQLGNQIQSTDSRGQTLSYTYDGLHRKTGEYDGTVTTDPAKQLAAWTYDTLAKGYVTSSTRYAGGRNGSAYVKQINGYNTAYQPTGTSVVIPSTEGKLANTYTVGNTYTPTVGLLATSVYGPDAGLPDETVGYGYDLQGLVVEGGSDTTPYLDKALYTPLGQVRQSTYGVYGKQLRTAQTYDQATGRLATNTVSLQTNSTNPIDATTYGYDQTGNLTTTSTAQSTGGTITATDTQCFTYDGQNQLAEAWTDTKGIAAPTTGQLSRCNSSTPTAATLGGPAPYWQSFTYNLLGDRTQQVQHDTSGNPLKNTTQNSIYPGNGTGPAPQPNTLTSTTTSGPSGTTTLTPHYDAAGSTTGRDTKTGTASTASQLLTYNPYGRTETVTTPQPGGAVQTSSYVYDADGALLIQKSSDTNVLYLFGGAEQLTLAKATNTVSGTRYYDNPDGTRITRSSSGTLTYQAANPQHTAQLQVDASSLAITRRAFDPYGTPRGPQSAKWVDNRAYLGQPTDTTSGLDLLGARQYDPALGRFLSVDPVLEAGDANQMGGYTYSGNDPVNSSDPSGLMGCETPDECGGGIQLGNNGSRGSAKPLNDKSWGCTNCDNDSYDDDVQNTTMDTVYPGVRAPKEWKKKDEFGKKLNKMIHQLCSPSPDSCLTRWIYGDDEDVARVGRFQLQQMVYILCGSLRCPKIMGVTFKDTLAAAAMAGMLAGGNGALNRGASRGTGKLWGGETPPEGKISSGAKPGCTQCFLAGTKVLMADSSTKKIEDVREGDQVVATDPLTGETGARKVVRLIITEDDKHFNELTIQTGAGTEKLTATYEHPFWSPSEKNWVSAYHLKPGMTLRTESGKSVTIRANRAFTQHARTYNLTVDDLHTYYVLAGNTPVLVHNTGCGITTTTEKAGDLGKYTEGQKTRDPASQWYHEELSNEELLDGINNPGEGDGILVSRDGTILGGHHRWDELQTRVRDGRIDPDTPIRVDVYDPE